MDKITSFRRFDESFDQTFSKVCGVEGQRPPRRPQTAKFFIFRRFSFAKLQLLAIAAELAKPLLICAYSVKEKSGINEFLLFEELLFL